METYGFEKLVTYLTSHAGTLISHIPMVQNFFMRKARQTAYEYRFN